MKRIFSILLFLVISSLSFSEVLLNVSNSNPSLNEPISLEVKFVDSDKDGYTIEGIENFKIISKGTQRNISIINGKKSSMLGDNYTVVPLKEGEFTLKVVGKKESSAPLKITVSKEAKMSVEKKMTFRVTPEENREFYFGEKIPYEETLLTLVSLSDISRMETPVFNDFSVKDIFPNQNSRGYPEKYFTDQDGNQGLQLTLYQSILQPNSSGEKNIKSGYIGVLEGDARGFRYNSNVPAYFGAKDIKLNILPLPAGKPANFQNVVGKLEGEYSWNREELKVGESVVLTLKLYGDVNLDTIEKVLPYDIAEFNVFETIKGSSEGINNSKYYAEKNFEVAFIPKTNGNLTIPAIKIPYFDTEAKAYKEFTIPEKNIKVSGSTGALPTAPSVSGGTSTPSVVQNTAPVEKIEVTSIPEIVDETPTTDNRVLIGVIILAVLEAVVIIYLLFDRKIIKSSTGIDLKALKNAKDDKDFYNSYCELMKKRFDFSPKAHLEDRLIKNGASERIVQLNRDIERKIYELEKLNRGEIIKILRKELK